MSDLMHEAVKGGTTPMVVWIDGRDIVSTSTSAPFLRVAEVTGTSFDTIWTAEGVLNASRTLKTTCAVFMSRSSMERLFLTQAAAPRRDLALLGPWAMLHQVFWAKLLFRITI